MLFPNLNTINMKIFFTSRAILQCLTLFYHLTVANYAISFTFKINIVLFWSRLLFDPRFQPLSELFIQNCISIFRYLPITFEVIQQFIILPHLRHNKIYMLTWYLLKPEIHTCTMHYRRHLNMILASTGLNYILITARTRNYQLSSLRVADNRNIFSSLLLVIRFSYSYPFFLYFFALMIYFLFGSSGCNSPFWLSPYFFSWVFSSNSFLSPFSAVFPSLPLSLVFTIFCQYNNILLAPFQLIYLSKTYQYNNLLSIYLIKLNRTSSPVRENCISKLIYIGKWWWTSQLWILCC